jgi:hypothetical protein
MIPMIPIPSSRLRAWFAPTAAVFLIGQSATAEDAASQKLVGDRVPGEWTELLNGKDLSGWTPKFKGHEAGVNYRDTFRVEDGLLKVRYDQYDEWDGAFGHLFHDGEYSHYLLRVTYRFVGEQVPGGPGWAMRNNGIMFHGQQVEELGLNQNFPASLEFQLLGGPGEGERPTASLCTPGTDVEIDGERVKQHVIKAPKFTFHGDQWVTLELEVRGDELIRHWTNGEVVLEYRKPRLDDGTPLDSGSISIQAETAPIDIKSLKIKELDPDAPVIPLEE